ncbi:MAG: leucine-rich repeat protein, partial [Muribaculaceae bacterium]|nr:leucine-rich repeat protein [Muribaculaceae bacterium]
AFSDCTGLKQVELNEGLTTIGVSAFAKCVGIEEIVFPSTVTTIEGNAFARCSSLKRIYLKSPRPAVITSGEYDTFEGVDKENCILYVPKGSLQTYWAASGWNEFTHIEEYEPESGQPLKGDVNGDGKVNVSDISTLINIILGIE